MQPSIRVVSDQGDADAIHGILASAFEPFQDLYTREAFAITVPSPDEIKKRIADPKAYVLVLIIEDQIVGTVSYFIEQENELYFFSMAVDPGHSGKGFGSLMLEELLAIARRNHCHHISLESFEPLKAAISIYERYGFERTGKVRDLAGSTVFEMKREKISQYGER